MKKIRNGNPEKKKNETFRLGGARHRGTAGCKVFFPITFSFLFPVREFIQRKKTYKKDPIMKTHTVKRGDTLIKISDTFFGQSGYALNIASYNGIPNPDLIRVGQVMMIPPLKWLLARDGSQDGRSLVNVPHGLNEIIQTFGDIYPYIRADGTLNPAWERTYLTRVPVGSDLMPAWDQSVKIKKIYTHV